MRFITVHSSSLSLKRCQKTNAVFSFSDEFFRSFVESIKEEKEEKLGKPDAMEKNDFLAMFSLVHTQELTGSTLNEQVLDNIRKVRKSKSRDNVNY